MAKKTYPPRMSGDQLKKIRAGIILTNAQRVILGLTEKENEKEPGITQTELAKLLWMSEKAGHRSILAYEKGERKIRSTIQLAIAFLVKYGPLTPP